MAGLEGYQGSLEGILFVFTGMGRAMEFRASLREHWGHVWATQSCGTLRISNCFWNLKHNNCIYGCCAWVNWFCLEAGLVAHGDNAGIVALFYFRPLNKVLALQFTYSVVIWIFYLLDHAPGQVQIIRDSKPAPMWGTFRDGRPPMCARSFQTCRHI